MEKNIEEKHYHIFQNIAYCFRFYKKATPVFLWLCLAEILFGALQPVFGIYLPKLAIDLVTEGVSTGRLFLTFGVFGLLCICVYAAQRAGEKGKYFLYNTKRNDFMAELFLKSIRVPYRYSEEGAAKELYWKALWTVNVGDWSALYRISYGTIEAVKNGISFVLYSAVLSFLNPAVAAVLLVLALVQYVLNFAKIRYMERFRGEDAKLSKMQSYLLYGAMGNQKAAKDIRIFGMKNWLEKEKENLLEKISFMEKRKGNAEYLFWQLNGLLELGRNIFAYVYLLIKVTEGTVGAGEFVLYFGAITGFSGFIGRIMDSIGEVWSGSRDMNLYRTYLELPDEELHSGKRHISELKQPLEIEFRDVSFAYEEGGRKLYEHFNLKIHAGEKLALVGVNGAGKTTLVKLLCGMYEPQEGEILLNGIDRNEFPRAELYQLFSAVFQEKFILPVTVWENLTFDENYEEKRVWKALEDAGLAETFRAKNVTFDTYFDKDLDENGLELSGGEEQRFLLARALYKDAPILVLDEPTAALDPIAESEVYDSYAKYTEGKTAIFISHRLASTRFSDRIVLLGEGGILEQGSHEELMRLNGAYAEMFQVQSHYYAKERLEKEAFQ